VADDDDPPVNSLDDEPSFWPFFWKNHWNGGGRANNEMLLLLLLSDLNRLFFSDLDHREFCTHRFDRVGTNAETDTSEYDHNVAIPIAGVFTIISVVVGRVDMMFCCCRRCPFC